MMLLTGQNWGRDRVDVVNVGVRLQSFCRWI